MLTGRSAALGFSHMQKPFESGLPNTGRDIGRVDGCALPPEGKQGGPEVVPALRAGKEIAERCCDSWVSLVYGVRCMYLCACIW